MTLKPQSLSLEDALEDSPQTRCLVHVYRRDSELLKRYMGQMQAVCQKLVSAQGDLFVAFQQLSTLLGSYDQQHFPLENGESSANSMLHQMSNMFGELGEKFELLTQQCTDCVVYPLTKFVQGDLGDLGALQTSYDTCSAELETSIAKHARLTRKEPQKKADEMNEEYRDAKQRFHDSSLAYFMQLNTIQYRRSISFLEPLVKLMQAWRSVLHMGHDTLNQPSTTDTMTRMQLLIQELNQDFTAQTQTSAQFLDTLNEVKKFNPQMYYAEPLPGMELPIPNKHLTSKCGYLFLKQKSGLMTHWDRYYFFTQGGNMMRQGREDLAGQLLVELNSTVTAHILDSEERRFVFQIADSAAKRAYALQATNALERDEWIYVINNIKETQAVADFAARDSAARTENTGSSSGSNPIQIPPSAADRQLRVPMLDSGSSTPGVTPGTPPSTPQASFYADHPLQFSTPIQFDLSYSSMQSNNVVATPTDGRQNPFGNLSQTAENNFNFAESFELRFAGCMEVPADRGERLVLETMRQIMAARAIHNIFKMTALRLDITDAQVTLVDPISAEVKTRWRLDDLSFWASHEERPQLVGAVIRQREAGANAGHGHRFVCYVFETHEASGGADVCRAFKSATEVGFQSLLMRKTSLSDSREQPPDEAVEPPTAAGSENQPAVLSTDEPSTNEGS